ncbi:hypothetical protein [Salinisphaera aquimarina]|uniref:DoxX family protein n=1 Tax=Salinisphaera aquimarina TaxID=2094031 RepID=A0ABV7ETD5_9GAMM
MPNNNLAISLLLLRLSVFFAILMWVIDKFLNPGHASGIFQAFYGIGGVGTAVVWLLGAIELLILLAFVAGIARTWSYGLVLLIHGGSTLASFGKYLAPFEGPNLLFFAAWPMWAGCIALFLLRDADRFTLGR